MSQPTPYVPAYDFSDFQALNPSTPLPANQVDIEIAAISMTFTQTLANLALIQRDDGLLANGSVGIQQLSDAAITLLGDLNPRGTWLTATAYAFKDLANQGGATYVCLTAHTSGVFATDLAANKWMAITSSLGAGSVTNGALANMAALTVKGNPTGVSAAPTDMSMATLASILPAFVGDSGAGGTRGEVPAPGAGATAAGHVLLASGAWGLPPLASIDDVRVGTNAAKYATPDAIASLWQEGADIASAATLVKPADNLLGGVHVVTNSVQIDNFWGSVAGGTRMRHRYTGAPLIRSVGNLIPPGGTNFQVTAGDEIDWRFDTTVNKWRAQDGTHSDGTPVILPGSGRNLLINGKMDLAQRGTSFAAIANNSYCLDRWQVSYVTSAVLTASQQADAPSTDFFNSLRLAVTTADAAIVAADFFTLRHKVEGYNARPLVGQTFTLSFWVRSSKTGVHCVAFGNSGADRSYVAEYTINAINTWERKTVTVIGGLITAGTWDWTNGLGLHLRFALAAGSTFQTTAGAWQTGDYVATASQVNCLDTIGNIFAVTGVQIEIGSASSAFEHRSLQQELALCQRYFTKSFALTQAPVQNVGNFSGSYAFSQAVGAAAATSGNLCPFAVRMRISPTMTFYNPVVANAQMRCTSASADCTLTVAGGCTGEVGFNVNFTSAAGSAVGLNNFVHWSAEAEI